MVETSSHDSKSLICFYYIIELNQLINSRICQFQYQMIKANCLLAIQHTLVLSSYANYTLSIYNRLRWPQLRADPLPQQCWHFRISIRGASSLNWCRFWPTTLLGTIWRCWGRGGQNKEWSQTKSWLDYCSWCYWKTWMQQISEGMGKGEHYRIAALIGYPLSIFKLIFFRSNAGTTGLEVKETKIRVQWDAHVLQVTVIKYIIGTPFKLWSWTVL